MKHKKFKGTFYPFDGSKALFLIYMDGRIVGKTISNFDKH